MVTRIYHALHDAAVRVHLLLLRHPIIICLCHIIRTRIDVSA